MTYSELKLIIPSADGETACAIAAMLDIGGIYLEDYSDMLDCEIVKNVGIIDEELLEKDTSVATLHIYLPDHINPAEAAEYLRERFTLSGIEYKCEIGSVDESDYAEAWKQYYKPLHIGEKIVVVPEWEEYEKQDGELILTLDPGMAFGTGSHETTSLCVEVLQKIVKPGDNVLDVGCGSGILSIASLILGADNVKAFDIDPNAVKVSKENAKLNTYSGTLDAETANILNDRTPIEGKKYNVIVANIVADIIIRLCSFIGEHLAEGGTFITSGIITERRDDVIAAFNENGFTVVEENEKRGWLCFCLKK
ncbi:MAG: 50S ribosomal protein L11 methyltransferase [Clostridia bacterium]|nr:50S ribosomal protein L11 methyltransferase [Clostridia bacterium]MBQ2720036.1 50S ribosomal protein L11 methyltransferase [Clostridia bacterium]